MEETKIEKENKEKAHGAGGARRAALRLRHALGAWGLILLVLAAGFGILYLVGGYRYASNDDVAIRDILSGRYTGAPQGRTAQLLYPLGALIASLYRAGSSVDVFGIFLMAAQALALAVIFRTLQKGLTESVLAGPEAGGATSYEGRRRAFLLVILGTLWGIFLVAAPILDHLSFLQYTFTAGLLGAAAALLMARGRFMASLGALLLFAPAFALRSEMALLLLPMIVGAGIGALLDEALPPGESFVKPSRSRVFRMGILTTLLVVVIVICGISDAASRSSREWREFGKFFEARTMLYDFVGCPSDYVAYEGHEEYYEDKIGATREEIALLEDYNFGVDEEMSASKLQDIARYAARNRKEDLGFGAEMKRSLWEYRDHLLGAPKLLGGAELRYVIPLTILYAAVLITAILRRRKGLILSEVLLILLRSILWIWLLYRGRMVDRVTHGLYLTEMMVLTGWWLRLLMPARAKGGHEAPVTGSDPVPEALAEIESVQEIGPALEQAAEQALSEVLEGAEKVEDAAPETEAAAEAETTEAPAEAAPAEIPDWSEDLEAFPEESGKTEADKAPAESRDLKAQKAEARAQRSAARQEARAEAKHKLSDKIHAAFPAWGLAWILALMVAGIIFLPGRIQSTRAQSAAAREINAAELAYAEYAAAHPNRIYFTDVYSTVAFTENIFGPQRSFVLEPGMSSRSLLGGWLSHSPLEKERLAALGLKNSLEDEIVGDERIRIVAEPGADLSSIRRYYVSRGLSVRLVEEESIGEYFTVYKIEVNP